MAWPYVLAADCSERAVRDLCERRLPLQELVQQCVTQHRGTVFELSLAVFKLSWTATKLPLIKYTPLDIEKDAAVDVALVAIHDANDSPDGINALLLGPETISLSANNNSPSTNVLIVECIDDDATAVFNYSILTYT